MESLPGYEHYWWLWHLVAVALGVIIFNVVLKGLITLLHDKLLAKNKLYEASFFGAATLPLNCAVWFFALLYALEIIENRLHLEEKIGDISWIYPTAAVFGISWFILRWKNMLISLLLEKKKDSGAAKLDVLDKLLTIAICFVGLILILEASGYSAAALLTIGGIGAAALAFASKEFIANFFGGLMIYITRPFAIGDLIQIPSSKVMGHVEEIGWYLTRIRDIEKQPIYVPNSTFSEVIILTLSQRSHRLIKEQIGLRYRDMEKVPGIIEELRHYLDENEKLDHRMAKRVHFTSFDSSSLALTLFAYTKTTDYNEFLDIKQEVLFTIDSVIKRHGAEMAFNTTTLDLPDPVKVS